jgi:hypothetical protein
MYSTMIHNGPLLTTHTAIVPLIPALAKEKIAIKQLIGRSPVEIYPNR